jgi:hypothetical protein
MYARTRECSALEAGAELTDWRRGLCAGGGDELGGAPEKVRVLAATRPVDFRKGVDSLAALARETLCQDQFSGTVLVSRAKRAARVRS